MDIDQILDDYRNGDEGKRLCLFFAFRDLRDYFSCIDHESPDDDFSIGGFPQSRKPSIARAA